MLYHQCGLQFHLFPTCFFVSEDGSSFMQAWDRLKQHIWKFSFILGGISLVHPGRLTWNLQITPFRRENDLPNLYDYVQHVNLPGCIKYIEYLFNCSQGFRCFSFLSSDFKNKNTHFFTCKVVLLVFQDIKPFHILTSWKQRTHHH